MARAQAGAVVTVEILVEQDEVTPVRVILKLLRSAIDGTPALAVPEEDSNQAVRDLSGHLIKVHTPPYAAPTFNGKNTDQLGVIIHQGTDEQSTDRHQTG